MGLLHDLRAAAPSVDTQFQPASNEVGPLLGALVYYVEHGDGFLKAAEDGPDAVVDLLTADDGGADDGGKAKKGDKKSDGEKK